MNKKNNEKLKRKPNKQTAGVRRNIHSVLLSLIPHIPRHSDEWLKLYRMEKSELGFFLSIARMYKILNVKILKTMQTGF